MRNFREWYSENKGLFWGLCIGLTVAILFLTIGFWQTLLIGVCVGVGAFLGGRKDIREKIGNTVSSWFNKK